MKIPAGINEGMRIRSAGNGEPGTNGGPSGDLYIEIRVKQHDIFERDGDDLHCTVPVGLTTVALGGSIEVPTLGGNAEIDLPEGTQHGKTFRLRGKGIKGIRSSYPGDLYAHIAVETPVKITEHQRKLLKELDESFRKGGERHSPNEKSWADRVKDLFSSRRRPVLEQARLRGTRRGWRRLEARQVQLDALAVQAQAGAGLVEALTQQLRPDALPGHARAEARVVVAATAHFAHTGHDARRTLGEVLLQPPLEQRAHLPGQAQHHAEGTTRTGSRSRLKDAFELGLVEERDHRRDAHAHRHAGHAPASRCNAAGAEAMPRAAPSRARVRCPAS